MLPCVSLTGSVPEGSVLVGVESDAWALENFLQGLELIRVADASFHQSFH